MVEASEGTWGLSRSRAKADVGMKIRLPHFKSDIEGICKNVK